MPNHRSRLETPSYPGAGTNVSCDARRRNAWLGEGRGVAGSRLPGAALAAVARGVLEDELLARLLDSNDVRRVAACAALDKVMS